MVKYIFLALMGLLSSLVTVTADTHLSQTIPLIPRPAQIVPGNGNYLFSARTVFAVENKEQAEVAQVFIDLYTHAAGFTPLLKVGSNKGDIRFLTDTGIKPEAYILEVTPKGILIKASDRSGFFYALQTIRQLLPSAIENTKPSENIAWTIPSVTITDEPRFGFRSAMLDVSRFFLPKENVLRIIDCMAMLKLNKLHFHLTDDQGWRIEIKKYPRLTDVGAWKVDHTDVPFHSRRNQKPGEPTPIGGYYTQDDIREIVAYAHRRQIEVIPEIEMPAHTNAALAAYPQLACPVVDRFISVLPGMGENNSGIIYCAGNDSVFTFLQDVIDEVLSLFPGRYIHLGGDEAQKTYWKTCPLCQERMRKEHLTHVEDLQGYFMGRMAEYVRSKGKEVIGWDELTNSKLPDDVIIYGWQGYGQAAIKAAAQGHRFVMTPARITYLIRYQGPQWFEPVTYFGNITLKDVFDYEPVQADWKPEYIPLLMGVQASMWTEFCDKPEDVDYLLFPRLAAIADVAWAQQGKKDWQAFLQGLDIYNQHVAGKGIAYARSMYNIQHTVTPENGTLKMKLDCIRPDVEVRYTTDGSEPAASSLLYLEPLTLTSTQTVKAATFMQGQQMGQTLVLPVNWNKATAKPIQNPNPHARLLINGIRGSEKYTDFEWCNWERNDSISFTIDLLKQEKISKFTIGCVTNYGMTVHKPKSIKVEASDDNQIFHEAGEIQFTPEQIFREGTYTESFSLNPTDVSARYIRVTAKGAGICPQGHVREGQESRFFFDEVIIE